MKGIWAMRKLLFALVIVTFEPNMTLAADAALEDIIGRWCVADSGNTNTFTKSELIVKFPSGQNRTLKIKKVTVHGDEIDIEWFPPYVGTSYELSDNKRTLVQLPNVDENGKPIGDRGPRLELHRC